MTQKKGIIIGAGPAGLTAAYELLEKTDIKPIIYEISNEIGGISRTIKYKGYRMDIGGHRFFSKSDTVMNWWLKIMPLERVEEPDLTITYQNQTREITNLAGQPQASKDEDLVMLVRNRKSRIFYLRKFFDYPLKLGKQTLINMGLVRTLRVLFSYLKVRLYPLPEEKNLEHFFINRFGKILYLTFFKSYTEKVWGIPCSEISAEWGAQRIKGLSISKAIQHIIKGFVGDTSSSIKQKNVETSLIERFLYPKLGPGQLWEEVARQIQERGGEIHFNSPVKKLHTDGDRITSIEIYNTETGLGEYVEGDFFFSTMPIKDLIRGLEPEVPSEVKAVSEGLIYRDFITVGLLVEKLIIKDEAQGEKLIKDNWIYVQEADVMLGRIQIFNNWSLSLVKDTSKVWLGLEYFCYENDELWQKTEEDMAQFAIDELVKIGFIEKTSDVLDYTVVKVPKTYPAYFGTYDQFYKVRNYLDRYENLYLIGRNGMHRYNNQDHSMLTAITSVENIRHGIKDKSNIWQVNVENEYHEEVQGTKEKVSKIDALVETAKQFVIYILTGGIATVVDVTIFALLVQSGLSYVTALFSSFIFGVSTNFFLTRSLVFGVYWRNWSAQYAVFILISLNSLFANLGLLKLFIDDWGWNAIIARIASAACVAFISFSVHKWYTFSPHNRLLALNLQRTAVNPKKI